MSAESWYIMNKNFKALSNYISLFSGMNKPKLNFQEMYKLFPTLSFEGIHGVFGTYENFGKAYEQKVYDMIVTDEAHHECIMVYREYGDANENLAYIS